MKTDSALNRVFGKVNMLNFPETCETVHSRCAHNAFYSTLTERP